MAATGSGSELWTRLDALIRGASDGDVRSHRLEVFAARLRRAAGRDVPEDFLEQERAAAIAAITAPVVLERVASAFDRPAIVVKGPELAALYPDPALRCYWDVDLLVEDAEEAQRALTSAGFEPFGDPSLYLDLHHLRPLRPSGLLLAVEIHSAPKWIEGRRAPSMNELLAAATPRDGGPTGVLVLPPEHHLLLLAAHSWAHEPLRRLRDIVDMALVAGTADRGETERLARQWGIERLWLTTRAVVESVQSGRADHAVLRLWARNLRTARERTVFENHLARVTSDFWALPLREAAARLPGNVYRDLRPEDAEPWAAKLRRSALAVQNARRPRSEHEDELDRRQSPPGRDA